MTNPSNPSELFSPFLPSTVIVPIEEDQLHTFLNDKFNQVSDVVNDKKIGAYTYASPNQNGENWHYKTTSITRNGFQTICFIQSLPNNTTVNITLTSSPVYPIPSVGTEFVITMLYGTASKPPSKVGQGDGDFFQYNNQGDSRITFTFTDNKITIVTTTDLSAYSGFIVCHYLQRGT